MSVNTLEFIRDVTKDFEVGLPELSRRTLNQTTPVSVGAREGDTKTSGGGPWKEAPELGDVAMG